MPQQLQHLRHYLPGPLPDHWLVCTTHVPHHQPKGPTDNMSKEMKQRLRQEYIGLGGAEGQVRWGDVGG